MKKTLLFLGSSVTYGMDVDNDSMCEYLAATDRFKVIKWAVPGTTLADIDSQSYVSRLAARRGEVAACDHFICQLSTNDAGRGLPLGEISPSRDPADFDTATVTGAMEWIIATARARGMSLFPFIPALASTIPSMRRWWSACWPCKQSGASVSSTCGTTPT